VFHELDYTFAQKGGGGGGGLNCTISANVDGHVYLLWSLSLCGNLNEFIFKLIVITYMWN
jgi:hypothetical protein